MKLTGKQKKYIKRNRRELSPEQMAHGLQIAEKDVQDYLKKQWADDDYKKHILNSQEKEKIPFNFKHFFKKNWPMVVFLTLLVCLAYSNSLNNAFVSDDNGIYQIKNLGTLHLIFSSPFHFIMTLFYSIAYRMGGYNPLFYRLINIIFHLGAVIGVYLLLTLLTDDLLGFIVASLFAVHPIAVESVAWISGSTYVQYGFFCLWALIAYIIFQQNKKIFYFLLSIILSLCALLSSEKAVVFPFLFSYMKFPSVI